MEFLLMSIIVIVVFVLILITVGRSKETELNKQEGIQTKETKDLKIDIIPMPQIVGSTVRVIVRDKNNVPLFNIKVVENSTGSSTVTDSLGTTDLIMPSQVVPGVSPTNSTISAYYNDKVVTVSYKTGYVEG